MALEDIFRALEEQADQECNQILADAREEAKAILADAEAEAERTRRKIAEAAESASRRKALQRLNAARLESKKQITSIKGDAVEDVFKRAKEELGKFRKSGDYAGMFERLMEEAVGPLGGTVKVLVDPEDAALAAKVAGNVSGVSVTVLSDIKSVGGLIATSEDGRIHRRNTLEDRLDKTRQLAQASVAEVLFAEGKSA